MVDDFNDIRKVLIKSSNRYCIDESMFGYCPQVYALGNLPHLLFEKDKPVNLGLQVKVAGDALLKTHLCIDLMEGAHANNLKKYNKEYGAGAGTVIRLHEDWYVKRLCVIIYSTYF